MVGMKMTLSMMSKNLANEDAAKRPSRALL